MTTGEQLLLAGIAAVGAFLVVKYAYKINAHKPANAPPSGTGVLGVSPVLNPAAPKTAGDFARYDRGLPSGPVVVPPHDTAPLTTGAFTRLDHDTSPYDPPVVDTSGVGWKGDFAVGELSYGD